MDALTAVGLFAVSAMLICYALEDRSHWFVLAFAAACALGSGLWVSAGSVAIAAWLRPLGQSWTLGAGK